MLEAELPDERSHEYGSWIIEAVTTGKPTRINGNVPNRGLIDNLPDGCCVEVTCLVDGNGVQPTHFGQLPPQLAALNRTNINVQELIVEAALTGNTDAVHPRRGARSADGGRLHAAADSGDDERAAERAVGVAAAVWGADSKVKAN